MTIFADELVKRSQIAQRYNTLIHQANLTEIITPPILRDGVISAWAQYTLRVPAARRSDIIEGLKQQGIPTAVHYPFSLSDQPGYAQFPSLPTDMPVARGLAKSVLSLPMHPYLTESVQDYIISALSKVVKAAS